MKRSRRSDVSEGILFVLLVILAIFIIATHLKLF